ncbi:MAG: PEGA domain-containing protein, partial [Candidatus Saccharibacteria bacterium]
MYRRSSKKKELLKRIAIYSVMTFSVLFIVAGLIFVTLGYRFDGVDGRVEQSALLQFATVPSGATIEIDGKSIGSRTPAKNSVLAGTHKIVMRRDGYETWQKTLNIKAGTLTWLNYARLVPIKRTLTPVAQYASVAASLATTDGRNIIIQPDGALPSFQLVNLQSDDIKPITLTLPASLYSEASTPGVVHNFRLDQWDSGGRYLLLQHTYGDKKEWLVVDTRNVDATVNVTNLFDLDISSVKFSGTNGSILYGLSGTDIRKIDISAGTISRTLVSHVTSFDLFETNVITYVGNDEKNPTRRVVGLYREGDSSPHILRTVDSAADVPLVIATGRYFNRDYVAIAEGNQVTLLGGRYPSSSEDNTSLAVVKSFNFVTGVNRLS